MTERNRTLFDGEPDARQGEEHAKISRFRPVYRKLSEAEFNLQNAIKLAAEDLEKLFDTVKPGRYRSLAYTALEESVMWAVKEITT